MITAISSVSCVMSLSNLFSVRSDQTFHQLELASQDLNIIGPLVCRSPTAKSGISLGPFVELMARSGEGADPASFKWALKTGHFYRFIRTFRTS